jgi:hypothetical protein
MNSRFSFISRFFLLLTIAFALTLDGVEARASRWGSGRLVVQRSANFGTYVTLRLWIDGRQVRNIARGRRYDRLIPAGPHVLTITSVPNIRDVPPTSTRVVVRQGQTYVFTARWDPNWGGVVLRRSELIFDY